ncbi:MAG TPA: 5-formyltetrahydrofolate cyclo-ligase [Alphaproteobacteria bacterium]|nr:5-formyltetrahydrofolate cyclo-ligase [Alphaproteobacteria bacterium]
MDIVEAKKTCRAEAKARRNAVHDAASPDAGRRLARHVLDTGLIGPNDVVSGFWPMGAEIDLVPLLTELTGRGVTCVLPVIEKKAAPLVFREWRPDIEMVPKGFGTFEPPESSPQRDPTVVLAPLLAFDAEGYRIGYGGGYYDRTLAKLRAAGPLTVIGVGYEAQEVGAVPRDAYDQPLDWIVTEEGARKFSRLA